MKPQEQVQNLETQLAQVRLEMIQLRQRRRELRNAEQQIIGALAILRQLVTAEAQQSEG